MRYSLTRRLVALSVPSSSPVSQPVHSGALPSAVADPSPAAGAAPKFSRRAVAAYDIVRGCRLASVTTNDAISYEMPDNATEVGTWRLTGAYDDVVNVDLEGSRFPLGTNLCSYLWAHTWGTARPRMR